MAAEPGWAARWDEAYAQGDTTCSWFQVAPEMSLRMLDAAGVAPADSVIDVGGGASPLAGALLDRGFRDVTVLDISAAAIEHARRWLGPRAGQVHWLTAENPLPGGRPSPYAALARTRNPSIPTLARPPQPRPASR